MLLSDNGYVELEKTKGDDDGEYYVRLVINNPDQYYKMINEAANIMEKNNVTITEVFDK